MSNGFWRGTGQLGRMSKPGPSVSHGSRSNGPGIRWWLCFKWATGICTYAVVVEILMRDMP
jgi:hypothetical protein